MPVNSESDIRLGSDLYILLFCFISALFVVFCAFLHFGTIVGLIVVVPFPGPPPLLLVILFLLLLVAVVAGIVRGSGWEMAACLIVDVAEKAHT